MSFAPWRASLAGALHRNRTHPYARYFQLATVRPDGTPANRTVVFRGFKGDTHILKIITDRRSEKIGHLAQSPWAEACWYFTKTREQFRLTGKLSCLDAANPDQKPCRLSAWQSISDGARSQFYWPQPGQPRTDQSAFDASAIDPNAPPDSFCLLLLTPIRVDHLKLRGTPQNRYCYQQADDGGWSAVEINP
ncbi:MAG: Npun_F5749 family FMN-dependent PPOX-type flavoprotein [Cyanobacteria bacterium P01_A01_bin.114]